MTAGPYADAAGLVERSAAAYAAAVPFAPEDDGYFGPASVTWRVSADLSAPVAGLYIAAGFSGHGFMHSPATAQLVVEEMLDGRARTIDIRDLSLERFQTGRRPFKATVL